MTDYINIDVGIICWRLEAGICADRAASLLCLAEVATLFNSSFFLLVVDLFNLPCNQPLQLSVDFPKPLLSGGVAVGVDRHRRWSRAKRAHVSDCGFETAALGELGVVLTSVVTFPVHRSRSLN